MGRHCMELLNGGHVDVEKILIDEGVDVGVQDKDGWTALHYAALEGCIDIAKILIEKGADVGVQDKNGTTALHGAARREHADVAKILIENGADVNVKDNNGRTAQDIAIQNGNNEIMMLIKTAKKTIMVVYKDIDILNMSMDELVRRADESAKRICRRD